MRYMLLCLVCLSLPLTMQTAAAQSPAMKHSLYDPGVLKPVDSKLKIAPGQEAPDFTLPALDGSTVTLTQYRGEHNVVLSFIPAAWTPVCSDQWPGYNFAKTLFTDRDTILIGLSVDNIPTLHAWTREMGELWFPVVSDFWPHGEVAQRYGVLRSDGTAERALIFIDKEGLVSSAIVSDINTRPPLEDVVAELDKLQ